jgi:putative hemolysin
MSRPIMILGLLTLAACGPTAQDRARTALATPAGQNCVDHGGKLIIRPVEGGQKAWCELPGRTITAQEFFHQTHP